MNSFHRSTSGANGPEASRKEQKRLILEGGDEAEPWTDPKTGEVVYVNTRTGLVVSTKDLERSAEPKTQAAHGHQTRAELPRLGPCTRENFLKPKLGTWAGSILANWENPVFEQTEEQIACRFPDDAAYDKTLGADSHGNDVMAETFSHEQRARITKMDLAQAQVISQVDSKFILVKVTNPSDIGPPPTSTDGTLVLIDQHAADERIKVEELLNTLCKGPSVHAMSIKTASHQTPAIETSRLGKPIVFELDAKERALFERHTQFFARWGIMYEFSESASGSTIRGRAVQASCLEVLALPPSIAERCRTEPKILVDLLRGEAWRLETEFQSADGSETEILPGSEVPWVHRIQRCPQGILDMINSRSCRSAIMFNDELSLEQCTALVQRLSQCVFPFQCAHGRPSMVPLVSLGPASEDDLGNPLLGAQGGSHSVDLDQAWREWSKNQ